MAALGDSLTLAYPNTVEESWSTGGNSRVRSHYLRILAAGGGAIRGHAYNLAVAGATFLAMQAQARRALAKRVEYVTVWGGEEWCGADDLATLEHDFDALLHVLASGPRPPWVFVASVRDQGAIYRTLRKHRLAVLRNIPYGVRICNVVLGKSPALDSPASDAAAATASTRRVKAVLERICRRYPRCRFDGDAVFRMPIAYGDLATDYVHLSPAGQRKMAEVTWRATFPFGR
jgi:lysophospholipase L1-like esterase